MSARAEADPAGVLDHSDMLTSPVEVAPVDTAPVTLERFGERGSVAVLADGARWLVLERSFGSPRGGLPTHACGATVAAVNGASDDVLLRWFSEHGGDDAAIVDVNGIGTLVHARAMIFSDADGRRIMSALGLLRKGVSYLRFGVSGVAPSAVHPGGEGLELSLLDGADGSGVAFNLCGHVPRGGGYARTIGAEDADTGVLQESRLAYCQTAILPRCAGPAPLQFTLRPERDVSLLDALQAVARASGVAAFGLHVQVRRAGDGSGPTVIGRAAAAPPAAPWRSLEDAAAHGVEQRFRLGRRQTLIALGTHYPRHEPDWTELSGRPYERRGHLHATLVGPAPPWPQHGTFHLRDVELSPDSEALVIITPVVRVVRLYPLIEAAGAFVCAASLRPARALADAWEALR